MKKLKPLLFLIIPIIGFSQSQSEAHLHLSLQNTFELNGATGGKLFFDKILVNGKIIEDYLPIKNDNIQNIKL